MRLPAKPEDELNDVREHHIHQQKKQSSNGGHHKNSDGGGPGFATSSPGNTRDFLSDLPYKLCWRCFCHGCLVPIQFLLPNKRHSKHKNGHTARFQFPTIWRPIWFSSDFCRYRRAYLAKSMPIGNRLITPSPAILQIFREAEHRISGTAGIPSKWQAPPPPTLAKPHPTPTRNSGPRQTR